MRELPIPPTTGVHPRRQLERQNNVAPEAFEGYFRATATTVGKINTPVQVLGDDALHADANVWPF